VPNFTTTSNQQHGIPCFIKEVTPPDWPARTRECVVLRCPRDMSKKKKRRDKERERADRDKVSLDALNAFRQVNGHEPLERLPLDFNPNLASAPSLVSPSPNEGAPLQGSSDTTPLERLPENTPLKGSQAPATLKRTLLEGEDPQVSHEEETVLDTKLDPSEEESASELDWGNDRDRLRDSRDGQIRRRSDLGRACAPIE
jgi:hypothetical protein